MIQNATIPSYEKAIEAIESDNNEIVEQAILAFDFDDGEYVWRVVEVVRNLLKRPNLTPRQIMSIGRTLHGLSRMPLRTPGLDIHISLGNVNENGAMSYDLIINDSEFVTTSGGYEDFGQGSDAISGPTFRVEVEARDTSNWYFRKYDWPDIFAEMTAAELEIVDLSDDNRLDWEHPDGSLFWEWMSNND